MAFSWFEQMLFPPLPQRQDDEPGFPPSSDHTLAYAVPSEAPCMANVRINQLFSRSDRMFRATPGCAENRRTDAFHQGIHLR
jgi:hypothetical protein